MAEWTTPHNIHSKCGEETGYEATKTIDDNVVTRWRHPYPYYHWIAFDMGESKRITKIRLYQHTEETERWGYNLGLRVYVSDDPANFGSPVWEGVLNAEGWQESGVFDKNGRYIKLESKANLRYQSMCEIDALVGVAPPPTHTLNINSSPITGVPVTLDTTSIVTPDTVTLEEGEYAIVAPEEIQT